MTKIEKNRDKITRDDNRVDLHGKYKDACPLPAAFAFLSGKLYHLYDVLLTQLKNKAAEFDLVLNHKTISCVFKDPLLKRSNFIYQD